MPCQQCDFEVECVVIVGADDRRRIRDPGSGQALRTHRTITTLATGVPSSSMIRMPSGSSPQTMVWPPMLSTLLRKTLAAKGEDGAMPTSPRIYVKACINGARTPDQHPNLPVTPEQLAAAAVAAHQAGAKAVHMHPKTADGVDSLHGRCRGRCGAGGARTRFPVCRSG